MQVRLGESERLPAGCAVAFVRGEPGGQGRSDVPLDLLGEDVRPQPRTVCRAPGSGNFGTGLLAADQVTASFMSGLSQQSTVAEQRLAFASASQTEMQEIELAQGVDTDAELARLMLIEQAYAANARMFEVVDELMQTLLRL